MRNIYLTDSDEKAVVDLIKDHEQLYHKTHEKFKDKAKKDCLWERFVSSHELSMCARCARLGLNSKGPAMENSHSQAPKDMTERQN